jgi:hypothetical protein
MLLNSIQTKPILQKKSHQKSYISLPPLGVSERFLCQINKQQLWNQVEKYVPTAAFLPRSQIPRSWGIAPGREAYQVHCFAHMSNTRAIASMNTRHSPAGAPGCTPGDRRRGNGIGGTIRSAAVIGGKYSSLYGVQRVAAPAIRARATEIKALVAGSHGPWASRP